MAAHLPNRQARATVPVESPSPRATGAGILYLWFPDAALRASALRVLREARRKVELSDSCLRVAMRQGELDPCLLELGAGVGASGTRRARALFVPGQQVPCLDDFGRIASLHELHVLAQTGWLLDQLENGRITSHFHPIVHVRDTSRILNTDAPRRAALVKNLVSQKARRPAHSRCHVRIR